MVSLPEAQRVDAVERRGLMQPDERVGGGPVPARLVVAVHQHHASPGVSETSVSMNAMPMAPAPTTR